MSKSERVTMRLFPALASVALSLLIFDGSSASAQSYTFTPQQTAQAPELPQGDGWRPVNPQPIPPSQNPAPVQTFPQQPAQPIQPTQPIQPGTSGSQFNLQSTLLLRSGDIIAATYDGAEPLFLSPGESSAYSLTLGTAMRDGRGNVVVPAGAVIDGQFQSVSGGTQFISNTVTVNGQTFPLYAQSDIIPFQKDPRQTSGEAIAKDAAIGAAAGAVLGGILGSRVISTEKVIGGALAGAVIGNVTAPESATISPGDPLNLTVTQDFQPALP